MLEKIGDALRFAWEFLIPRFLTEDVALYRDGSADDWSSYEIACRMDDVKPHEVFSGIAEVDSFSWLGLGITYRIGNFSPWPKGASNGR